MGIVPWRSWNSCSPTEESPGELPKTSRKWARKWENVWVAGPAWLRIVSAHWSAGPVREVIKKAILDWSVGNICGCKSMVRVHCKRKPLHSSAESVKGAGLAMGLVKTIGEEELGVLLGSGCAGAGHTGGEDGWSNTLLRESTSSWKGSRELILFVGKSVRSSVTYTAGHSGK